MKDYDRIKAQGGPFDTLIKEAADTHGVPYEMLHKQIFLESSFNPNAKSPTGPRGLGQFTRATGKAYGLVTEEDFFDPAKSVDAAARHMRDNIQAADGDHLKALLAYNQGAGRKGQPQLDAYDRGDFGAISEEGRNYMAKLADVASVGKRDELASFVKPASGLEAPAELIPNASPPEGLTAFSGASMSMGGSDVPKKAAPFKEDLYNATGRLTEEVEKGLFDGTLKSAEDALKMSPLGMAVRAASADDNADFAQAFATMRDVFNDPMDPRDRMSNWTDEDYDRLKASGLDPQFYDVVLRGYKANFDANLKLAQENERMVREQSQAGIGGAIVGGAAGMAGDPWTFVNPARSGGATLVGRLAGGAVVGGGLGALSEETTAKASGREADYLMAIGGGMVFGGAVNGLLGARPGSPEFAAQTGHKGVLEDWQANNTIGVQKDMDGEALESILARHGDSALPNRDVEMDADMLPVEKPQADMDDMDMEAILARHGERGPQDDGRSVDIGSILARYGESADPHEFTGDFMRLEARERARMSGLDEDPTAIPYREGDVIHEDAAVPYMDMPFNAGGAVRLQDGTVVAGGSPLNPKTLKTFTEVDPTPARANLGVRLGDISEIGLVLGRSTNADVLGVANDLFRAPTGYKDKSGGKFGATASDIVERLRAQDNVTHNMFKETMDEALKEPYWHSQRVSAGAKMEAISRRVVESLEAASHGGPGPKLTGAEQKLVAALKDHMGKKWDYIENPGQFGNQNAKSLLGETRHEGSYFPMRYSTSAKHMMIGKLGGADELQEAIVRSWLSSYAKRPATRARVNKMIEEKLKSEGIEKPTKQQINAAVEDYARSKAYGISHTDQFNRSAMVEEHLRDGVGVENNNYLEARNLFDSDVKVHMPDGTLFAVDDLREFNILRVVPQYDRRVNGDIALMGGTGKSTAELKSLAVKLGQNGANKTEATALEDALKLFTGRSRRTDIENGWETAVRSLMDVGFATKNAFMGMQNFTEAARLAVNGHVRMLTHGVPFLKHLTTAGTKLSAKDIKVLHGQVFGRELDDLIRPTRTDIVERLREARGFGSGDLSSQVVGSVKWATGEIAARSPFTWLLRETGNYIMDAARQGVLVDIAEGALSGKGSKILHPDHLRAASITPDQLKGIEDLVRAHFKQTQKGKWSLKDPDALAADPRSMDLWRLGDAVADQAILRPHKISMASSQQLNAYWSAALQFKMFVLRSLNSRVMRTYWEGTSSKRQALDHTYSVVLSVGMAAGFYAAQARLKAYGMQERDRKEYLDKALSSDMLGYAALTRSSHVGAPLGVAGFVASPFGWDPAAAVRTSILPRGPREERPDKPIRYGPLESPGAQDFISRTLEQVPAAQVVANAYQATDSAIGLMKDQRGSDLQGYRTGMWNAFKHFVPNDPISQHALMKLAEANGVDRSR